MARIVVTGSANMDLVIPVPRLPLPGETVSGGDLALYPGGKGANQACAAARLGGRAEMIAQVGEDAFGDRLIESLASCKVDVSRVGRSSAPTGCASIYVASGGENSIVISPGANATLDAETAVARLEGIGAGDFLLCQLEIPLQAVAASLASARAAGATTILDPAPARTLDASLLALVDYLTPNHTEAATLLNLPGWDERDPSRVQSAAEELLRLGPKNVVLKLGEMGCYLAGPGVRALIPGFRVTAVDTTAAGDVFNGALAVAISEGRDLIDAAVFANAAAAISVQRAGAQSSIPGRAEADALAGSVCYAALFLKQGS